jgi:hypothetical protein
MIIKVKRHWDGKIFTSDMSDPYGDVIIEIHFCTSYTQVIVQDKEEKQAVSIMILDEGTKPSIIDTFAIQGIGTGSFV